MLIIQKLVLTLLAIALIPVFFIAGTFYLYSGASLQGRELSQLSAVAAIEQGRIEDIIAQDETLLTSYTHRVGLTNTLEQYDAHSGRAATQIQAMQETVDSLKAGVPTLDSATLVNPAGMVLVSTSAGLAGSQYPVSAYVATGRVGDDVTTYLTKDSDGSLHQYLVGPLTESGALVGVAILQVDDANLTAIASDANSLGQTAEVMLVRRDAAGGVTDLLPMRFNSAAALSLTIPPSQTEDPGMVSLDMPAGTYANLVDWNGQKVLGATRAISQAGWGLAVTISQTEANQPLASLANLLIVSMFIMSVVIIFFAFYLARSLNEPILELAIAAEKIRGGDLSQRVKITSSDEIGRLTATFNSMVENVEKVDQMKSEFVLLASHQLRTPATAVKGFISMLLDGYAGKIDAKHRKLLEAAYGENERQISVINSILDVARMEAGEMILERKLQDVGRIAAASAEAQANTIAAQEQTITVHRPKTPVMSWVDGDKLQLVIDNLIHNATKYSERGKHIAVTVKRGPKSFSIEVKDAGIGIAHSDMSKLFKRFSRIATPDTANIQGAGLGLYLADRLVKLHGGKIVVKSKIGHGTSFTIEIPNASKEDMESGESISS